MTNILEATFGATSTTDDVLSGVNLKGNQVDPEASQEESAIGADTKAAHPPSSCVSALD